MVGETRTLFACELLYLRLRASLPIDDVTRTYESLSDRETDGASYTIKPWSDNDGIDRDQVALPKNDDLHAEQCFLESVAENWYRDTWLRSQSLYTIYNLEWRRPEPVTNNGDAVPSHEPR